MTKFWHEEPDLRPVEIVIGVMQLLGLLFGLKVLAQFPSLAMRIIKSDNPIVEGSSLVLLVALGAFYTFSGIGGILLIARRPSGRLLSIVVQVAQLPTACIGGTQYLIVVGASLWLHLWPKLDLQFLGGNHTAIWMGGQDCQLVVGLNLIALFSLSVLIWALAKQRKVNRTNDLGVTEGDHVCREEGP